jgi:hypothetical protein
LQQTRGKEYKREWLEKEIGYLSVANMGKRTKKGIVRRKNRMDVCSK